MVEGGGDKVGLPGKAKHRGGERRAVHYWYRTLEVWRVGVSAEAIAGCLGPVGA